MNSKITRYEGEQIFSTMNAGCRFPEFKEGNWRRTLQPYDSSLPWPVAIEVAGYDKFAFIGRLYLVQRNIKPTLYRGLTANLWTGKVEGMSTYSDGVWEWPGDFISYLEFGVPPSRAFYKHITGTDLESLPEYGRDPAECEA